MPVVERDQNFLVELGTEALQNGLGGDLSALVNR